MEADDLEFYTDFKSSANKGLFDCIIDNFETLPKTKKNVNLDDYGVISVSPSVVPNPYLPTFRIFTYNITDHYSARTGAPPAVERAQVPLKDRGPKHPRSGGGEAGDKKKLCKEKEHRDSWKCMLHEPWYSDDEAPSRKNTLWSPLGYAQVRTVSFSLMLHGMLCARHPDYCAADQKRSFRSFQKYYLPDLGSADENNKPKYELEYLTFRPTALHPPDNETDFHYPLPLRNLPHSLRNETITTSKYTPYHMDDLTIPSWIQLARTLAKPSNKKLRKRFKNYMFMGGKEEE